MLCRQRNKGLVLGVLEEKGSVTLNKWSRKPSWDECHHVNDPEEVGVQYIFFV